MSAVDTTIADELMLVNVMMSPGTRRSLGYRVSERTVILVTNARSELLGRSERLVMLEVYVVLPLRSWRTSVLY
jgi:hypothetical protein